MECIHLIQKQ